MSHHGREARPGPLRRQTSAAGHSFADLGQVFVEDLLIQGQQVLREKTLIDEGLLAPLLLISLLALLLLYLLLNRLEVLSEPRLLLECWGLLFLRRQVFFLNFDRFLHWRENLDFYWGLDSLLVLNFALAVNESL